MSFLDRIPAPVNGSAGVAACKDEKFAKAYPALVEFMSVSILADGQVRRPSSFTVFFEEGVFKICLSERDRDLTLWATGESFLDALKCLEGRLESPKPEWRRGRQQKPGKRS